MMPTALASVVPINSIAPAAETKPGAPTNPVHGVAGPSPTVSGPGTTAPSTVNVASLPAAPEGQEISAPAKQVPFHAPLPQAPSSAPSAPLGTAQPPVLGITLGSKYKSGTESGLTPPDHGIAVGTGCTNGCILDVVNSFVRINDRNTHALVSTFTLNAFIGTSDFIGDVDALYDLPSGRYFMTVMDFTTAGTFWVAISNTGSPTGTWSIYPMPNGFGYRMSGYDGCGTPSTCSGDQARLGVSGSSSAGIVAIGVNVYGGASFFTESFGMNKAEMMAAAFTSFSWFDSAYPPYFSVIPAQNLQSWGPGAVSGHQYYVSAGFCSSTSMTVFSWAGIPGVSAISVTANTYTIGNTGCPPDAPQANTATLVASSVPYDARVTSVKFSTDTLNGGIWVALTSGCTPAGDATTRACVRLTMIDPPDFAAFCGLNAVCQDFNIGIAGLYLYYPALSPVTATGSSHGTVMVVFQFSDRLNFPSIGITGQRGNDPANSYRGPVFAFGGLAPNLDGRFGDYSAAAVDPIAKSSVWFGSDYISGTGFTWNSEITSASIA